MTRLDLGDLGLDRGGHLLLQRALGGVAPREGLEVRGRSPELGVHLRAWCRDHGHGFSSAGGSSYRIVRGSSDHDRWRSAERAGGPGRPGGAGVGRPPSTPATSCE